MKSMLLLSLVFNFSFAENVKPRTQDALKTELNDETYSATLTEGFHFNEKAPNALEVDGKSSKPTKIQPRIVQFDGLPKEFSSGRAYLYICDDALTYCEPRKLELKSGGAGKETAQKSTNKSLGKVNKNGFIEGDLNAAVEKAKRENKLILVDFSARWCPGCMRLEAEVLPTKEFKNLTKDIVKVKIDTDKFENAVLSEKFKIQGIPSLIVLDQNMDEIDRLYDYQPISTWQRFFGSIKADPTPISKLKEKAATSGDNSALLLLGQRLWYSSQFDESVKYLSKVKPPPPELNMALISSAEEKYKADSKEKANFVKTLKKAIDSEPESSRSITWRTELVGLLENKDEISKYVESGVALADSLLKDPALRAVAMKTDLVGEFTGFEPFMIGLGKVDLLSSGGAASERVKQAWLQVADIGKSLKINAKAPGPATRYLGSLVKSERFAEAEALSQELLNRDPQNGEVQRRRMRVFLAQKKYEDAIKIGKKSLANSYGKNEFWVAEGLAEAYLALNKKAEAGKLLDQYLSRTDIQWPSMKGSKAAMEELRAKAQ